MKHKFTITVIIYVNKVNIVASKQVFKLCILLYVAENSEIVFIKK